MRPFITLPAVALALIAGATALHAEAFNPKRYPLDRYSKIWEKSPFEFEIMAEETIEKKEDPFENLRLAGYTAQGDVFSILLYDVENPTDPRIRLKSGDETEEGIQLVEVERGKTFRETKIHLKKGDYVGTVGYDDQRTTGAATGAVGMASQAPAAPPQRPDPRAQQPAQQAPPPTPEQQAEAQQNRNEVIQRLLERAKQTQAAGGGNAAPATPAAGGRRPRVILPPSN